MGRNPLGSHPAGDAAKRSGVIPTSPFTQLAAPVAQLAAIGLVIGIYVLVSRQARALGAAGAAISVVALAGLVGVEFVLNLVFPYVDPGVVAALRAGPLGIALTVVSMLFLLGTAVLMLALWRSCAPVHGECHSHRVPYRLPGNGAAAGSGGPGGGHRGACRLDAAESPPSIPTRRRRPFPEWLRPVISPY